MYWRRHQLLLCFIIADKLCFRNKFAVQGARRADQARCREVVGVSPGKGAGKREALASWQRWSTTKKWLAFPRKTVTPAVQHSQNFCRIQGRFWQKRWKIVLTRQLFPPWQRNLSILHPVTTFKDLLCGTWNLDVKQAILGLEQAWTSTFNLKFIFAITS